MFGDLTHRLTLLETIRDPIPNWMLPLIQAFICLPLMWAAISTRHWFVRLSVALGTIALLLPVRGYDAVLFNLSYAVFLIGGFALFRHWRLRRARRQRPNEPSPPRLSFSLVSLLLLMTTVAAVIGILAAIDREQLVYLQWLQWTRYALVCDGLLMAIVSTMAYWATRGGRRLWGIRFVLIAGLLVGAVWGFSCESIFRVEEDPMQFMPTYFGQVFLCWEQGKGWIDNLPHSTIFRAVSVATIVAANSASSGQLPRDIQKKSPQRA